MHQVRQDTFDAFRGVMYHNLPLPHLGHPMNQPHRRQTELGRLDDPIWIQTGPEKEDIIEGGEEWFGHIFGFIT